MQHLLGGEVGIESTEPTRILMKMASEIAQYPELLEIFNTRKSDEVISNLSCYPEIDLMFKSYIERYGDRTMGELKLETISLREDPAFVIEILKNYIGNKNFNPKQPVNNEKNNRSQAEKQFRQKLRIWKKNSASSILRKARTSIKYRENMRLTRTRAFGMVRDLYLAVGYRLVEAEQLKSPRDIFYLTVEELRDYYKGRAVTTNLKGLVALRKDEYAAYEKQSIPHQFETIGPVYFGNRFRSQKSPSSTKAEATLSGIGCYPGIVEECLKVISNPQDDLQLDGQILVAERTDPGWAPLFPTCSGILVERGSTLSHSAVIAREMGIPAVVGVNNLFDSIVDGEKVRLDGGSGVVTRLAAKTDVECI
jgi:phosphoenolpyruvate synthase/pyruvate phosphate dikinase